jgi:DNA-binding GntR family transcriptional regulator
MGENPKPETLTVPRQALHQEVAVRLRQLIVEGRIAPGAKLNERELSERLHVSRTPLREAIKMLAAEGLVELLPNRGAVAVQLTSQDVADTFEVIAGLEAQAGELAAERITPVELDEIRALHYEMLAAFTRRDLSAYYALNSRIHQRINAAARNPVLTQVYANVNARLQALRFRSNFDERKWRRAVQEHEDMVALLARRDAPALRALMAQHLRHKRDAVLELMAGGHGMPVSRGRAGPPPVSPIPAAGGPGTAQQWGHPEAAA